MIYTIIQKYSSQHTHLKFDGLFLGEKVCWDTHFYTLKGYKEEQTIDDTNMKIYHPVVINMANNEVY